MFLLRFQFFSFLHSSSFLLQLASFGAWISGQPHIVWGACFLSDTLLSICHDVVAFTGITTFSGLLISFRASLSVLQLTSLGCCLVELSFSVVFDEMSVTEGGLSSSNSIAISGVFVFPFLVVRVRLN